MKPTPTTLRNAAESYVRQIVKAGKDDGIEGLVVMVVLAAPNVPPQCCTNLVRPQVPQMLEELRAVMATENLLVLAKGRAS